MFRTARLIASKIVRALRREGIAWTIRRAFDEIARLAREMIFDLRFGVDTAGSVNLSDLQIFSASREYGNDYSAVDPRVLRQAINNLGIAYQEFVFVDFGSGKGRALLVASEFPFKRIIGVEFAPQLHTIAQENIRKYKSKKQRCKMIEALCMDAASYPILPENVVFYIFNSFQASVMHQVLTNIRLSLENHPRKIFIVYRNPICHDLLDSSEFLQLVGQNRFLRVYASKER
jgi:SAM-dependent methyltransferase